MPDETPVIVPEDGRLAKLTGAPRLIEGRELRPHSLRDLAIFKRIVREFIATEYERHRDWLTRVEAPAEALAALKAEALAAMRDPLASSFAGDDEMLCYWAWLSLKKADDAITLDAVAEWMAEPAIKARVQRAVAELNSVEAGVKNA